MVVRPTRLRLPIPLPRRRALLWLAGWVAYGVLLGGLKLAVSRYPTAVAARWIVPTAAAVTGTWIVLTPLLTRVDLAVRRARLAWRATLLVHGTLARATALLLGAAPRAALTAALGGDAPGFWPLVLMQLDVDVGTYAAMLWVMRAATTHRELVRRSRRTLALETALARARLTF